MADTKKAYVKPNAIPSKETSILSHWYNNIAKPAVTNAGTNAINFMKAHPAQTIGYGATGLMNLGGLFDNDKVGGQLLGGALGTGLSFIPQLIPGMQAISTPTKVLMGMSGGALGSLFDKLRAEKEKQQQQFSGGMY